MPSSASNQSTSGSSSNGGCSGGGSCQFCCEIVQPHTVCQLVSCTPVDTLPGYSDSQQFVALPPVPRERGRTRLSRSRPPKPRVNEAVFCSPVILSTSTPETANSSNSSVNGSLGSRWRPRRRRSASMRQRQDASLIRQSTETISTTTQGLTLLRILLPFFLMRKPFITLANSLRTKNTLFEELDRCWFGRRWRQCGGPSTPPLGPLCHI